MKTNAFLSLSLLTLSVMAADWPTYRHDGKRTALSAEAMPAKVFPQWTFVPRHAPKTAWLGPRGQHTTIEEDAEVRFLEEGLDSLGDEDLVYPFSAARIRASMIREFLAVR